MSAKKYFIEDVFQPTSFPQHTYVNHSIADGETYELRLKKTLRSFLGRLISITDEIQMYIARILKTKLFNGLKAIIISLPHSADDAIRHNSDLIGLSSSIARRQRART